MRIEGFDNSLIRPVQPINPIEKVKNEKKKEEEERLKKKKKSEEEQIGTNVDVEI